VREVAHVVFVHGIGRARQADAERGRWTQALANGARQAGRSRLAASLENGSVDIALAYYGDLFGRPQAQGNGIPELDEQSAPILEALLAEVIDARLAAAEDARTRDMLKDAQAQLCPGEPAQFLGDIIRRTTNAATTLWSVPALRRSGQWISDHLLLGDLAQVARYLARGEPDDSGRMLDERIRGRLSAALGPDPVVVVAHSLGTVVCLEALHEHQGEVPLLITLGSPIAMRTVVWPRLAPRPPSTPPLVRRWLNFWDRDDIICARPRLEDNIVPNLDRVRPESRRVASNGLWTHTVTKYLAQSAVADAVSEATAR
jgi:hypothetical protein